MASSLLIPHLSKTEEKNSHTLQTVPTHPLMSRERRRTSERKVSMRRFMASFLPTLHLSRTEERSNHMHQTVQIQAPTFKERRRTLVRRALTRKSTDLSLHTLHHSKIEERSNHTLQMVLTQALTSRRRTLPTRKSDQMSGPLFTTSLDLLMVTLDNRTLQLTMMSNSSQREFTLLNLLLTNGEPTLTSQDQELLSMTRRMASGDKVIKSEFIIELI